MSELLNTNQELETRLAKIEAELAAALPPVQPAPSAQWMQRVFASGGGLPPPEALLAPSIDLLSRGGKRWRPLLASLVCQALGGGDTVLPLVPLVEFCHNASLIHDDIEDNSEQRRGKAAVHRIYGEDTAINSGAFLYFLPLICIDSLDSSKFDDAAKLKIYKLWGENMRRLHLGQSLDIDWHKRRDFCPKIEDYFTMCRLKTGVLARFAAELGALCAGFEDAALQDTELGEAAAKLGVGFQILDDVKNLTTGIVGKERGDDIVEGKMSLPILLYLKNSCGELEFVQNCFAAARRSGVNAQEVSLIIDELLKSGAIAQAQSQGVAMLESASGTFGNLGEDAAQSCVQDAGMGVARSLLANFVKMLY
jgi:octaprenyl-diphosphate synthase